jgi:hypothetical protein
LFVAAGLDAGLLAKHTSALAVRFKSTQKASPAGNLY